MTDKEKIRAEIVRSAKLRKDMMEAFRDSGNINAAANENVLYGFCLSLLSFIDSLQEEPVSDDLGDYINKLSKQFPEVSFAKLSRIAVRVAKWQKEKEYTCYEEAFEDGANWQKEQMMEKAVEIARKETLLEVAAWISDTFIFSKHAKEDFSQTFNIKKELL